MHKHLFIQNKNKNAEFSTTDRSLQKETIENDLPFSFFIN